MKNFQRGGKDLSLKFIYDKQAIAFLDSLERLKNKAFCLDSGEIDAKGNG
jgi:hypothetical protein